MPSTLLCAGADVGRGGMVGPTVALTVGAVVINRWISRIQDPSNVEILVQVSCVHIRNLSE